MSMSERQIQEHLFDLGYIDRGNSPTLPFRIYEWCRENRVSAPVLDSALGWRQGTTAQWVIAKGLPHLTGEDPNAGPPPATVGTQYGSGYEGTQAPAAPAADPYSPEDLVPEYVQPEDPQADFLGWVQRTQFRLPGDEVAYWYEASRRRVPPEQLERWMGIVTPGGIRAVARERGLL